MTRFRVWYLGGLEQAVAVLVRQPRGVARRNEEQQIRQTEQRKQNQRRLGSLPADTQDLFCKVMCTNACYKPFTPTY